MATTMATDGDDYGEDDDCTACRRQDLKKRVTDSI
jgi:hypothetical protein